MTLPSAFFGVILLPEVQDNSSDQRSNVVDHQTDTGFKLNQIAQRELTEVDLQFILRGDSRFVIKSALEYAQKNNSVSPFISANVFFLNAIITNLRINKSKDLRSVFNVTMKVKEIVQTGLAGLTLIADGASYGLGVVTDLIKSPNSTVEDSNSIEEQPDDIIRSTQEDVTGNPMNESDPLTESATQDATEEDTNGDSFADVAG